MQNMNIRVCAPLPIIEFARSLTLRFFFKNLFLGKLHSRCGSFYHIWRFVTAVRLASSSTTRNVKCETAWDARGSKKNWNITRAEQHESYNWKGKYWTCLTRIVSELQLQHHIKLRCNLTRSFFVILHVDERHFLLNNQPIRIITVKITHRSNAFTHILSKCTPFPVRWLKTSIR